MLKHLKDDLYFSSEFEDMDIAIIFSFIKNSYWGNLRTKEEQILAMQNSMNFGLFQEEKQIGYARVMTDGVFFAYLLDVFILEEFQGKGYATQLMHQILKDPGLEKIDKWMLATRDAHDFYKKFNFETVKSPHKLMDRLSDRARQIYE